MGALTPFNKQTLMIVLQRTAGVDVCEIQKYSKFNSEIGEDNTFQIQMSDVNYCGAKKGDIVDVTSTEFGGIIKKVQHSNGTVTLTGTTWRGLLGQHIIPPSVGTLSGDARYILRTVLTNWLGASGFIRGATGSCGINISNFNGTNKTILDAINEAFAAAGVRMVITYESGVVTIDAEAVQNLSNEIEMSQDYSAKLYTSDSDLKFYNHCIAVGDGIRAEAWRKDDGTIVTSASSGIPTGLNCVDILIESEKEDEIAKLREKATEKLKDGLSVQTMEMDISDRSNLQIGDIIAAYDDVTQIALIAAVNIITLNIEKGRISINYEVKLKDAGN